MLSKLKDIFMAHNSRRIGQRDGKTAKNDGKCEEEQKAKGELQDVLAQSSQPEDMDTQDYSADSPILFPSQASEDKESKEGDHDEDSDCYEIVEKSSLEKEKSIKNSKDRSRMSLGRKRQVNDTSSQNFQADNAGSKQRRVASKHDVESCAETTEYQDVCLLRVYKKPLFTTLEEADRNNLYYAPRNVNPESYTQVIINKLEKYRQRLRRAQCRLKSSRRPIHLKAIHPGRSQARVGGRDKRTNVIKKNTLDWVEHKKNSDPFVAALYNILTSVESNCAASDVVQIVDPIHQSSIPAKDNKGMNNDDVICTKVSPRKRSKPTEVASRNGNISRIDHPADVITTCDNTTETVNNDGPMKTSNKESKETAKKKSVNTETGKNNVAAKITNEKVINEDSKNESSSPVKPVLNKKLRKEEVSSDDDSQTFTFQLPKITETQEADCVVVEAVSSKEPNGTVAKKQSREQETAYIECPMCFKKFPEETIQRHAFLCNGLEEASTSSSVRNENTQDGEMSPVIKTRTPTKVKELKLLANVETKTTKFVDGNKDVKRNSATFGRNMETKKPNKRRISLEPSIKLTHIETTGIKCHGSATKKNQNDMKENEKKKSTPQESISETLQRKRLTLSNARKNLERRSWPNAVTSKKDFIPLEFAQIENEKISSNDVNKLLALVENNSTDSSSDEESNIRKHVTSKRKMGKPDDELSTVARTTNDCKSRKRKNNNNVKNNPKKIKVFSDDEIEHCYICGEDIPRSEFNQHVNDELERKRKEDEEKDCNLSLTSSMSQNTQSDEADIIEDKPSSDSRFPLPDLAEGTTRFKNEDDSPLKTYKPIQEGSVYHKQFSFHDGKGQSDQEEGRGRTGRKGLSSRRKR